jgi:hypothetical protein
MRVQRCVESGVIKPMPHEGAHFDLSLPKMLSVANAFEISDHQYNPR